MTASREGLHTGDVAERAAFARTLSREGGWSDVAPLVEIATADRSPSLRLYAAAAAANILHRVRIDQGELTSEQIAEVSGLLRPVDPATNPSILLLLSAIPDRTTVDRLCRMMRDLRQGVREGALLAFGRMVKSDLAPEAATFERSVRGILTHRKCPADTALGLVVLAGDVGMRGLSNDIRAQATLGRGLPEAIETAVDRLAARESGDGWEGVYLSDGNDVGLEADPGEPDLIVVRGGTLFDVMGERPLALEDGGGRADGYGDLRLIWARPVGSDAVQRVIQSSGTTWWRCEEADLPKLAEAHLERLSAGAAAALAAWVGEQEGAVAARMVPILLHRSGDDGAALAAITALTGKKKPRNDLFYWQGRIQAALGDADAARTSLGRFLDNAGKSAKLRSAAETLLAEL